MSERTSEWLSKLRSFFPSDAVGLGHVIVVLKGEIVNLVILMTQVEEVTEQKWKKTSPINQAGKTTTTHHNNNNNNVKHTNEN